MQQLSHRCVTTDVAQGHDGPPPSSLTPLGDGLGLPSPRGAYQALESRSAALLRTARERPRQGLRHFFLTEPLPAIELLTFVALPA